MSGAIRGESFLGSVNFLFFFSHLVHQFLCMWCMWSGEERLVLSLNPFSYFLFLSCFSNDTPSQITGMIGRLHTLSEKSWLSAKRRSVCQAEDEERTALKHSAVSVVAV